MSTKFSWYPGHMKKAMDSLSQEVKGASAVVYVLDARCPESSFNPHLEKILKKKPIVFVLNKADMASVKITGDWLQHFNDNGKQAVLVSCKTGEGKKKLIKILDKMSEDFFRNKKKKYLSLVFKIMVVGVPNTGKSSVINLLSPQKTAKTGKKPGLTRGKQWLKIKQDMEVLDSPGIAPPRMDKADTGWILGSIAAIKQEILPIEEVAGSLIRFFIKNEIFPEALFVGGKPEDMNNIDINKIITDFASARGFLVKGGDPEREKACLQVLKMFREGKFGRISLEKPE